MGEVGRIEGSPRVALGRRGFRFVGAMLGLRVRQGSALDRLGLRVHQASALGRLGVVGVKARQASALGG